MLHKTLITEDLLFDEKCVNPLDRYDCGPQVPSWEREIEPLEGWTIEEQRALAAAAKAHHNERALMIERGPTMEIAHWQFLRLLAREVPGKSARECERCLQHVETKRVAYFGPQSRSESISPLRSSKSPQRSSKSPLRSSISPLRSSAPSRTGSAAST